MPWGAADFFTAYFLLSPEAKAGSYEAVASGQVSRLLPGVEPFSLPGSIFSEKGIATDVLDDVAADQSLVFDDMMVAAVQAGHLPFSFAATSLETVAVDGDTAVAQVQANPMLTLDLARTAAGQWCVDSIAWQGAGDGKPWG
ncbi:MAG TPA: hypothetical protein VGM83_20265 [Devosiaceae bacterium]|jgi:hypothetical protein